jgi:hypothetical protein
MLALGKMRKAARCPDNVIDSLGMFVCIIFCCGMFSTIMRHNSPRGVSQGYLGFGPLSVLIFPLTRDGGENLASYRTVKIWPEFCHSRPEQAGIGCK